MRGRRPGAPVHDESDMTAQAGLLTAAGASALLALAASIAEWRRNKRRNLDRVGWVPWQLVTILAFFAAIGLAAAAFHS